ncbi:MAG TPA: aminotransferase class I/II-fold pyridoxal phosphate-dependent enzyme, partial [Hadesarchaea archaeon]|nr:aminotransferase class I/II-fold pyridoxal phosphate-dependent enzyme [Hadesarchaea archaeon]
MIPLLDLKRQYATIEPQINQAVKEVFEKQAFILGSEVEAFENDITGKFQTGHAIGVSSGTDALLLSLMALGVGEGDEVITSPFTFFATAGVIHRLGAIPVFVDIEESTFNLNPDALEEAITERTACIIPVHIFGQMADMEPIANIAKKHDIPVVEDAAQAIG